MSEGELKKRIEEQIFSLIVGMHPKKYPAEAKREKAERERRLQEILDAFKAEFEAAKTLTPEKQPWDKEEEYSMQLRQLYDCFEKWFGKTY